MYQTTELVLSDPVFQLIWNGLPAFVRGEASLAGSINVLAALAQAQGTAFKGITLDKNRLKLTLITRTLIVAGAVGVFATLGTSNAMEDRVPHSSPDGSVTIKNGGDAAAPDHHFEIVSRGGDVLLASDKHPDLETGSFAENIAWSPDGRYVAFSVRTSGPYMRDTFVYSVRSKQLVRVLTEDDDYQTRPVRWHDNRTLIVQTEAPFGGKATEDKESASYRYRRTIRVSGSQMQLETLYTTPRTHPKS